MVGAVPGFMGYQMLQTVIEGGKNIVDISFFPEDPFDLDELAKQKNVIAVMDCGVAPGMGNIILGHHDGQMKISDYECLVGGLPEVREWLYEYKAVSLLLMLVSTFDLHAMCKTDSSLPKKRYQILN